MSCEPVDIQNWRDVVAYDWLWVRHGKRLHHAQLTDDQLCDISQWSQLGAGEPGEESPRLIRLDCGRTVDYVGVPGMFTRMTAQRCKQCCDVHGYPYGKGSPKNDNACRVLLGMEERP